MKNRFIITISDIHGSKQFSVHEIIKKVIFFAILTFLLIGVITFYYVKFLNTKVATLNDEAESFKGKIITLKEIENDFKKENKELSVLNQDLAMLIQDNSDKLSSMNEKLHEVEEIIGIGPELNASFATRIEQAKEHEEKEKKRQTVHIKDTIDQVTQQLANNAKKEKVTAIQKALLLNSIPNGKPLTYRKISSKFGYRTHPTTKKKSFHAGLDLSAKHGTPIYAPASGVVVFAKRKGAYGNFLLLTHSYGFQTAYGHLSRFAVKSGDYVSKGQRIAYVGNTGRSTGPHLHYEIRYLSKWVDPLKLMRWDLDKINHITDKIKVVDWKSILKQTQKLINLSAK
ncbi:MAG: hypothetical protein DRQ78_10085 [Epsilonproteobacteria bacterium]|nr:MAG: hypothetical protein DRQ78_10085 [Campylobacterota bacterium]